MQFDSWADFIAMGGYGFYVWLSFGLGGFLLIGLVFQSIYKQKSVSENIAKRLIRQQKFAEEFKNESSS